MKKAKFLRIIMLFAIFFMFFTTTLEEVYCATNSQYNTEGISLNDNKQSIIDKILGFLTNVILTLLAYCIVGIAGVIQMLVSGMIGLLTWDSSNMIFPWADRIIFNGMPILDVNFLNPAEGSLFKVSSQTSQLGYSAIGESVRNIYFTGLSIALGFLGIIVAIMAIRLALSSIASEKAKYKDAIVHWATALVLLFGMHYLIAFVFYINEQLVEVASKIVLDVIGNHQEKLAFLSSGASAIGNTSGFELMGHFFMENAMNLIDNFGFEQFTYAILYAVFIVQSLMFLWAYLKRFFYVLILALIAPFVVVYDFLVKSVS